MSEEASSQGDTYRISVELTSEEFRRLSNLARDEHAEVGALAATWIRARLAQIDKRPDETVTERLTPAASDEMDQLTDDGYEPPKKAGRRGKAGDRKTQAKDVPASRGSSAYIPIVLVAALFVCGMLIILSYAGARELSTLITLPVFGDRSPTLPASTIAPTHTVTLPVTSTVPVVLPMPEVTVAPTATATTIGDSSVVTPTSIAPSAPITPSGSESAGEVVPVFSAGDTLADLLETLDNDLAALLRISRTITVEASQPISLAVVSGQQAVQDAPAGYHYVFPVQPPSIAQFENGHHDYPATDIFAPERSVVVAVTDGVVQELSRQDVWNPSTDDPATRGGISVAFIGSDGIRYYYSHLDELIAGVEPGAPVVAGQLLGYVGDSGNAIGVPHLHFGISPPTVPGDWETRRGVISPFPFLQAWLQGDDVSPSIDPQ